VVVLAVVTSPLVVPETPLDVLVVEAVWLLVPVEPPPPVVSVPVLLVPSVLALVLLTAPALVPVAPPLVEPVVPEPALVALELEGPLADSGCDVEVGSEPQAAAKNAKRMTVSDSDALYMPRAFFRTEATRCHQSVGARSAERFNQAYQVTGVRSASWCDAKL